MAVIGRQFLLLKIPEEAAESAKFTVQSIICHRTRETEARLSHAKLTATFTFHICSGVSLLLLWSPPKGRSCVLLISVAPEPIAGSSVS